MLKLDFSLYLGQEDQSSLIDFISDNRFFLIIESQTEDRQSLKTALTDLKGELAVNQPPSLGNFNDLINQKLNQISDCKIISLASGYFFDGIIYLVSQQQGQIYLYRKNKLELIVSGDHTASGYLANNDFFIFCSQKFHSLLKDRVVTGHWQKMSTKEIIDELTLILKEQNDIGAIAIMIKTILSDDVLIINKPHVTRFSMMEKLTQIKITIRRLIIRLFKHSLKKLISLIIIIILSVVLCWTLIARSQQKQQQQLTKNVVDRISKINLSLIEAEDLSDLNRAQSLIILNRAEKQFEQLKKTTDISAKEEIDDLRKKINQVNKQIRRIETRSSKEFYSLKLIDDNASGSRLSLTGDDLIIIDQNNNRIYQMSVNQKSHTVVEDKKIKQANLATSYDQEIYFISSNKIYKFIDNKAKAVVDEKKGWQDLADFWIYNGNLYLLDRGADEIYKYLVTDNGFSNRSSYFRSGQAIDLSSAKSMAIDSSVYLLANNYIFKFTSGLRDGFKLDNPEKNAVFDKLYTDGQCQKLYLWDKKNGKVFVFSKTGGYEKQISSSVLQKGTDFVVSQDKQILILKGNKIFTINL